MVSKIDRLTSVQHNELIKSATILRRPIRFLYELPQYDLVLKVQLSTWSFSLEDGTGIEVLSCKSLSNNKLLNKLIKDMHIVDDINNCSTSFGDTIYGKIKKSEQYKTHDKRICQFLKKLEKLNQNGSDW